ncbi:hypothetical protein [Kitasatospora sp. NPDC057223]|uniref:hypothetical protein n=1 Tax=Kitasatospora sp. NPDC057223 TaxID=3346055 RepID=UPI003640FEBF
MSRQGQGPHVVLSGARPSVLARPRHPDLITGVVRGLHTAVAEIADAMRAVGLGEDGDDFQDAVGRELQELTARAHPIPASGRGAVTEEQVVAAILANPAIAAAAAAAVSRTGTRASSAT